MIFNHRQKRRWEQETLFRLLPADQRLGTDHRPGAQIHLGLVIQDEFPLGQGAADVFPAFMMTTNIAILFGVKNVVAILAGQLVA
jgi:hypothetical protein